jgi:disulfide bond formation protein DsbB
MAYSRFFDLAALTGVCLCLAIAFFFQFVMGELPCAFCNLERVGFMIFGGGLFLNLRHGMNRWNYVLSGIGALVGSLVALLQMFVHALPGTPPTGTTFLGLHMYFWTYIILTGAVVYSLLRLAFAAADGSGDKGPYRLAEAEIVSIFFVILVGGNFASAFLQNGFHPFKAGGQQHYQMLYDGDVMKP